MNRRCDGELEQYIYYVYTSILVYKYQILKTAFLKVGIYCHYTVFFHFIQYNRSCTALDMYHMILKHHETMPLSGKSFDVR